ncbi:hypothetical protein P3X46_027273 [Hevea brasiliensis]|uniref:Armadillo repeat-containing domain-containing protein n=1 Tax=Hevea brasiliensis TaxID=3981 RepID=A0ABQ9KZB4_HEVBR|nr:hypothetical protein P3X46_027273 [Hevea brasiliensis]
MLVELGAIPLLIELFQDGHCYKHSVSVVRKSDAVPVLVELLRDGNGEVRGKVSGAIAQLSYNEADRAALADSGEVPILIELLYELEDLKDNAAEILVNLAEDPCSMIQYLKQLMFLHS